MRVPGEVSRLLARLHAPWTRFVFILAPMRSGTTLLNHVLAEAPGLLTAGETHLTYGSHADLRHLVQKVYRYTRYAGLRPRTIVEKCVTDELVTDPEALVHPRVKIIFMLRDAVGAVGSLLSLAGKNWPHADDPADATAYFVARCTQLRTVATRLGDPRRAFFLPYETLTDAPHAALDALGHFLEVSEPLQPDYGEQRWTGVPARGDLSETIRSGAIAARPKREAPTLTDELRARIVAAHAETTDHLQGTCTTVPPTE